LAILWQKQTATTHYEVRRAGGSIRLYTNGIFHSQWNSKRPLCGHLWDLLVLPALALQYSKGQALILGLGGGAAINGLQHFCDFQTISAVELDKQHIQIAKRWFLSAAKEVQIHHADARDYLTSCRNRFDYIIDDLFAGSDSNKSDARRAIEIDKPWLDLLIKRLTIHGSVVLNLEDIAQAKKVARLAKSEASIRLRAICQCLRYENAVLFLSRRQMTFSQFQEQLEPYLSKNKLDVRVSKA
jgi:predicted membrane-bound spermidine synthase